MMFKSSSSTVSSVAKRLPMFISRARILPMVSCNLFWSIAQNLVDTINDRSSSPTYFKEIGKQVVNRIVDKSISIHKKNIIVFSSSLYDVITYITKALRLRSAAFPTRIMHRLYVEFLNYLVIMLFQKSKRVLDKKAAGKRIIQEFSSKCEQRFSRNSAHSCS